MTHCSPHGCLHHPHHHSPTIIPLTPTTFLSRPSNVRRLAPLTQSAGLSFLLSTLPISGLADAKSPQKTQKTSEKGDLEVHRWCKRPGYLKHDARYGARFADGSQAIPINFIAGMRIISPGDVALPYFHPPPLLQQIVAQSQSPFGLKFSARTSSPP